MSIQAEIQREFDTRQGHQNAIPCVQVRLDQVTTCARVLDHWTTRDGLPMTKLQLLTPWHGTAHVPDNRIRACSGVDGRCTCVAGVDGVGREQAQPVLACDGPGEARGAVCALPDGNHGDNNLPASQDVEA